MQRMLSQEWRPDIGETRSRTAGQKRWEVGPGWHPPCRDRCLRILNSYSIESDGVRYLDSCLDLNSGNEATASLDDDMQTSYRSLEVDGKEEL
jgi:hypothetical protein